MDGSHHNSSDDPQNTSGTTCRHACMYACMYVCMYADGTGLPSILPCTTILNGKETRAVIITVHKHARMHLIMYVFNQWIQKCILHMYVLYILYICLFLYTVCIMWVLYDIVRPRSIQNTYIHICVHAYIHTYIHTYIPWTLSKIMLSCWILFPHLDILKMIFSSVLYNNK